ncbi:MAG: hypothetical protein ABFS45_05255 [Pseudomonadota bacterium]
MAVKSRVLLALLALLFALAGLLLSARALYTEIPIVAGPPSMLDPEGFEVLEGTVPDGESLVVSIRPGGERIIVRASATPIDASVIKAADIAMEALPEGMQGAIYWRRAEARRPNLAPLPAPVNGQAHLALAHLPGWSGSVSEIGLLLRGQEGQALTLHGISLVPHSLTSKLRADVAALLRPETWSQRSINFLVPPRTTGGIPLTSVAAAALGFVVLFAALLLLFGKTRPAAPTVVVFAFILVWLALDARWQSVLQHNLADAAETYTGKNWSAKQAAGRDGPLYRYAEELKHSVFPDVPQRIFIIHNSEGHKYARLRLQYHLLPHNVYNFGKELPTRFSRAGDYVVFLGKVPGVSFDDEALRLNIKGQPSIPAERIHRSRMGTVFRITREAS